MDESTRDIVEYALMRISTVGMNNCKTKKELDDCLGNVHELRKALRPKYFGELMSIYKKHLNRINNQH